MIRSFCLMLVFSVFVRFGNNVSAQAPQNFNFQAVARDASGNLLANQSVAFRISILQASASGTSVYVETHPKTTNAFGQATLSIGGGTVLSGNFSTINWGAGNYYLKIEMDATGGSSFVPMGTTQLLSVPYALYSNTAGSGGTTYIGGTGIEVTGTTISNTQPNATHTGDATGSEALTVVKIQGRDVASTSPVAGQVLKWNENGSQWEPGNDNNTHYSPGTGISVIGNIISNTAPDQTLILTGTGGTTVSGTYPNFTINSATGGGSTYIAGTGINILGNTITNTEPNATHTGDATGSNYLTVAKIQGHNVASTMPANGQALRWNSANERWEPTSDNNTIYSAGSGISIAGGLISNTAPDQTVSLLSGTGINITGTYPEFTVNNTQPNSTHTGDAVGSNQLLVVGLNGNPLSPNNPANGQVLKWNGSQWDPSNVDALPSASLGQTLLHDGTNWTASSNLYNDGYYVGVNVSAATDRFQVHNGNVAITNDNNTAGAIKIYEPATEGQNFTAIIAQGQAEDITYTLPNTSGSAGDVLTTNGLGLLNWTSTTGILPSGSLGQTLWNNGSNWLANDFLFNNDSSIGIGTTVPKAQLHLLGSAKSNGSVLFEGEFKAIADPAPVNGSGTRMMWYPDKAAFRVGSVDGDNWHTDSIGNFSVAMGSDAKASGTISTALGYGTTASGDASTSMGWGSKASGTGSTSLGYQTTASGNFSTALGAFTIASGVGSLAAGNLASALSFTETSFGRYNTEYNPIGTTEWNDNDRLFVIGNGIDIGNRSNALTILKNGRTGLGTDEPLAMLHTKGMDTGKGNVLFEGELKAIAGPAPVNGSGTRMMWYPDKAAFRVGSVDVNNWHTDSIGNFSVAMGFDTKASGAISTALGYRTAATAEASSSLGWGSTASGTASTSLGYQTSASGDFSTSLGTFTVASGVGSLAAGNQVSAKSFVESSFGYHNTDYNPNSTTEWNENDRLFVIGNGIDEVNTSNALTILKNGRTGVGTDEPLALLHTKGMDTGKGNVLFEGEVKASNPGNAPLSGSGTRMMWYPDKAAFRAGYVSGSHWDTENTGKYSSALGHNLIASGESSFATGYATQASGNASIAMGSFSIASGEASNALGGGTLASGNNSTAMGFTSQASGNVSTAMGENTLAKSYRETALGSYNTNYTPASLSDWNTSDRLFVVGNGTSDVNRSNALTMLKNGNTGFGIEVPNYTLDVKGSINLNSTIASGAALYCNNSEALWYNGTYFSWGFGGSYNYFANKINIGNLYNPGSNYKLVVAGDAWASGNFVSASDSRFKKDVQTLSQSLNNILKTRGTSYRFRTDEFKDYHFSTGEHFGFIAQELETVFPQLVSTDQEGYKSINYTGMIPVLTEAIKEQNTLIELQKKENEQQQKLIEELLKRIEKLENK